jgi:cell division transport system permease protein
MSIAAAAAPFRRRAAGTGRPSPIVPPARIAGHALLVVIAIMTFLSCLTLGAVSLVRDAAGAWQNDVAREATVQIKPADGLDMAAALQRTAQTVAALPGVSAVRVVDDKSTARLLEPWLGPDLDIAALPVPRLVIVAIDRANPPDFALMRERLAADGFGAALDDHRTWVDRLVAMAGATVGIGLGVLGLILAAATLCVVFATRGAMAGSGHIIEVLHFVGAERRFIAGEFRRHFLVLGFKGALAGAAAAALCFLAFGVWSAGNLATPEAAQASALFGRFAIGPVGYAGAGVLVLLVAGLAGLTSHLTVVVFLGDIETRQTDGT